MEIILLLTVLTICVITDIRSRKIYNVLTVPTVLIAILFHTILGGWQGFLFSSLGLLAGLGLLFIPFIMGVMGAGDVKLMGAIGALMGASFVFYTFLYAAIIGGLVAAVLLYRRRALGFVVKKLFFSFLVFKGQAGSLSIDQQPGAATFPYGVAIGLGAGLSLFLEGML
ncbi:type 4 prepilin peptidase 1 [Halobacillus andaensis]|uniref:Type 4 prepilin peptidase 1 n=1 Tax=Halobacillus andaensis TaxID=1176239 RepID=A0A917B6D8_HALAA|nr:prepilin peptidase [Halobacillus andaensis]MBP2006056.1 prepilin peptidase CpaA [Halobacillus andaensis]GGF23944.1 type 4 prepilin peptidase 1 [Halobacillus andaensis]